MKNQVLSIEQMKHLKELGADVSKASMVCFFIDEDGIEIDWDSVENHGKDKPLYEWYDDENECWVSTTPRFYDAETGYYDHSNRESRGVFTLQDMLNMMPKQLKLKVEEYRDPVDCSLMIDFVNGQIYYEYTIWGEITNIHIFSNDNLLISTYEMLCWLAEKGHLTKKEEEEKDNCHVCGKTDVELSECECCGELYCEDCSSTYNQFTQIDYNCCKPCSKRERE